MVSDQLASQQQKEHWQRTGCPSLMQRANRRLAPNAHCAPSLTPSLPVQVLNDLADPSEGVYSATALMEERLGYTHRMLARHYQMPIVPEAGTKGRNANTNVRSSLGSCDCRSQLNVITCDSDATRRRSLTACQSTISRCLLASRSALAVCQHLAGRCAMRSNTGNPD